MFKILKKLNIKIIIFFLLFVFVTPASATTLYFSPEVGSVGPDNVWAVDVLLDVEDCVNTVSIDIAFPSEYLQLQDFIIGESILSIWVNRPDREAIKEANLNGLLNFAGGIPGGYCGKIPGDPGRSNTLARLIFKTSDNLSIDAVKNKLNISFLPSSQVFLNDGVGTLDKITTKIANFEYSAVKVDLDDAWLQEINKDTIPPEPFIVELRQNRNIFNNQYYIIFNTTDKQSGLDHFEVLEIRPNQEQEAIREPNFWEKLIRKKYSFPHWQTVNMPYVLSDQKLLSIIRVKAVDKAGNERFVEYIPPQSKRPNRLELSSSAYIVLGLLFLLFLALLISLIIFIRKIIINKKYDKEKNNQS